MKTGVGLVISAMLQYYSAKPLMRIKAVFSQMNTEEADLSRDVKVEGEDDLQDLFGGYNLFLNHLRDIITKLRSMGIEIAIDSTRLAKKIGQTTQKSEQQTELSKFVAAASNDANIAISEISQNTQYVSEQTSRNLEEAKKTYDGLANGAENIRIITENVQAFQLTVEELSMNNTDILSKVETIDGLTHEIAEDMQSAANSVSSLQSFTENMQAMVCRFRTGHGRLDRVIAKARAHRDHCQERIGAMQVDGMNVFDRNYRPVPDTDPQKFATQYSRQFDDAFQAYFDSILDEIDGTIYAVMLDVNGYLPTHHKKYSQPPTGEFEVDVVNSRDKRIFDETEMEIRRAKNTTPMLLQTNMRDTGEILTDISLPIHVGSRHWGAFIMGINPEIFIDG